MADAREPREVVDAAERAAAAGDYASAEQLLREAALLQQASLGPLHPDLANTLNNLGVVCEITAKPIDAEHYFRRAYAIATAALDADHPFVATSRKNLEDFCAARGTSIDPPRADVSHEQADVPHEQTVPVTSSRSNRPVAIGVLIAGAVLVAFTMTAWLRSRDQAESAAATPSVAQESVPTHTAPAPAAAPIASEAREEPARDRVKASSSAVAVAQLCRELSTDDNWRCTPPNRPIRPGTLFFYTRLRFPKATTVQHRWYRDERVYQLMKLQVGANPTEGYRTYSRTTVGAPGDWRVELRAADGTLLHEERFVVR